ncbi:hypothetical protein EES43_29080 [Streptomyces sp. ADI96-02]|uniref:DUF6397 family protein n=1 Tax=Streptomyces sp. ADI96-02 TaxID=1522760 RepID=UPI000F903F19|nr:DUF6397 family protein [Streptomyces sp. ADI96-02]RPK54409.1 hypothetical protein EES43_29080 [Streptomyces sp. ADI96-02]
MTVKEASRTQTGNVGAGWSDPAVTLAAGRAAQELGLRKGEFELAVHMGLIAVDPVPGGGRPRVREAEIARLREQPDFPDGVAERVRTVGTAEGAALLRVAPARFTRLAKAGCLSPVTFCLNRYRAVVWLYLADEIDAFALREPELLAGPMPPEMRDALEAGGDRRARNWRLQRVDRLLKRTRDPWVRAAIEASALDPVQLAEVVDDPYERAYLLRVRPEPVFGRPVSIGAREAMARLSLADDPDEILWRRVNVTLELDRAREERAAPHPGDARAVPAVPGASPVRPGVRVPSTTRRARPHVPTAGVRSRSTGAVAGPAAAGEERRGTAPGRSECRGQGLDGGERGGKRPAGSGCGGPGPGGRGRGRGGAGGRKREAGAGGLLERLGRWRRREGWPTRGEG